MKISEITAADIWRHIRESPEDMETEDNTEILVMKKAAVEFCKGYTGLTEEQLDEHEDITDCRPYAQLRICMITASCRL